MLSRTLRPARLMRLRAPAAIRSYSSPQTPVSKTNEVPTLDPSMGKEISETLEEGEKARSLQAPNRKDTWSRSQQKRELAMSGPRFEHTIFELQVGLPFQWSSGGRRAQRRGGIGVRGQDVERRTARAHMMSNYPYNL